MSNIVVLTGAGISAESGISTFRDSGGLWEGHDIMEVASAQGWNTNPSLVLDFYNRRRKQAHECSPNLAHTLLAELGEKHNVKIITQNVDNLHEKAGSKHVLHLHGELSKVRSTIDSDLVYYIGGESISIGSNCEKGSQLRPHIVWFGEAVSLMDYAIDLTINADIFVIIGTSLAVYPAASLIDFTPKDCKIFIIDPNEPVTSSTVDYTFIEHKASVGVQKLIQQHLV